MRIVRIRGRKCDSTPPPGPTPLPRPGARFGPLDTKLFCRLPFTEVNIMEDGRVYPNCCPDWLEFPLGNLHEQTWDEIWNGEAAQRMRQSMFDGDLRHCDQYWCPHIQNARHGLDDHLVSTHDQRDRLDLPGEARAGRVRMAAGPTNIGMHYDASCNLACPTCRGDIEMLRGEAFDRMAALHAIVEAEILPSARTISLTGTGDPFASKFLRDFLIGFDRARYPNLENVHLHTNAIMWTPRLWARMPGLRDIRLSTDISIDAATAGTYEVVRRPGRWEVLNENLRFIETIPNLHTLGISMTLSKLNHRELLAFYEFGQELAARVPDKFVFVEYKRARRRGHHSDEEWDTLALEAMDDRETDELLTQLRELDRMRSAGAVPHIRSNLDEFLELAEA